MRLVRLKVDRFRGVRHLDWFVPGRLVCLVGPGDAGKSTVLQAVAWAAWPRTALPVGVWDFFGGDPSAGLSIEATFADLPDGTGLLADSRFGLLLGGVDVDGNLHGEPGSHEPTLTVRLEVDGALDPMWRVITEADAEGRMIGPRDRAALGVVAVDSDPDRQFTWARGSALARATSDRVVPILVEAHRLARAAADSSDLSGLAPVIDAARDAGRRVGAGRVVDELTARLNLAPLPASTLALHADGLPVPTSGLGTRRLLAAALELLTWPTGGVACLDEVESGLEPHRLRHLLRFMKDVAEDGRGQSLVTSHSPTVVEELGADNLSLVREDDGEVSITSLPVELVALVRANAAALLSRRIVVAEGKTEIGVILGHEMTWAARQDGQTLAALGVSIVDGNGASAPQRARAYRGLGYEVLLLADSDQPLNPSAADLEADGVTVVQWPGQMCTEQRLVTDLQWESLTCLLARLAEVGTDPVQAVHKMVTTDPGVSMFRATGHSWSDIEHSLDGLTSAGLAAEQVRESLWRAATTGAAWFKRIDSGRVLGEVTAGDDLIAGTPSGSAFGRVEAWCYSGD